MSGDARFVYHPEVHPDDIPTEAVSLEALAVPARPPIVEFAIVPSEVWAEFRPRERLLLALHFAYRTFPPDEPGGWYRLSSGLYSRAGLTIANARWRAVNALEKAGKMETRRANGKTTLVRLKQPGPKNLRYKRQGSRT